VQGFNGANPGASTHTPEGGGPPWAQALAQADGRFSFSLLVENWRATGRIIGALFVSLILIVSAAAGLRRLARIG
jgi:hypothetical protein